jgi:hypothetical protein
MTSPKSQSGIWVITRRSLSTSKDPHPPHALCIASNQSTPRRIAGCDGGRPDRRRAISTSAVSSVSG